MVAPTKPSFRRGTVEGDHRILTPGQTAMVIDLDFEAPRPILVVVQIRDLDNPGSGTVCSATVRTGVQRATLDEEALEAVSGFQRAMLARSVQVSVSNGGPSGYIQSARLDVKAIAVPMDISIDPSLFGSGTSGNNVPTIDISTDPSFGVPTSKNDTYAASVATVAFGNAAKGMTIYNDSATANLFVSLGSLVSTTNYTIKIAPSGYYETPFGWSGPVVGVWDAAVGNARVTRVWS